MSRPGHRYRADIDGLRSLAVLPILFNHAGVKGFGGGYVGVDIFFVISGYLITGILVRDLAAGRFSIAEFYRRRIARIFPALFVMVALVSVVALLALMPSELVRYARSVGATTLFVSNVLFYTEAGYFDAAAHSKPLLHTWSLGIEEQFYILWPWLLVAVGVGRPGLLRTMVVGVSLLSFAASAWLVQRDMSATFYLLPTRAWELGLGGVLAVFNLRVGNRWLNEALAVMGLGLIAYAITHYFNIVFPGPAALVPCGGAALLILTGPRSGVARLLSLWPLVFVGRISYSLYLWHWPVIVFADLWLFLHKTPAVIAGEILLSLILATLSWRYVETPVRVGATRWPTRRVLVAGGASMGVACLLAGAMMAHNGLADRFTPAQAALDAFAAKDYQGSFRRGSCFIIDAADRFDAEKCLTPQGGRPTVLLMGDSTAAHYWPGLSRRRDRFDVLQATMAGCRPIIYGADETIRCRKFFRDMILRWIPAHRPAAVILAGNWRPPDYPLLKSTLAELKRMGVSALVVGLVPQYEASLPRLLVFAERGREPDLVRSSMLWEVFGFDRQVAQIARQAGVAYVSPISRLCHGDVCRTFVRPGVPMQFDDVHLAPEGSATMVDLMMADIVRVVDSGRRGPR